MRKPKTSKKTAVILGLEVDSVLKAETEGDEEAFAIWLHKHYVRPLSGQKLTDFAAFMQSPLALDMIADWRHECSSKEDRVELLSHILFYYAAEDFDEQEHFDKNGAPILFHGEPREVHYDKDGKPIAPYVLVFDR